MYAIINKHNFKWLYGTDWNYNPPKQRLSRNEVKLFRDKTEAKFEFKKRSLNPDD